MSGSDYAALASTTACVSNIFSGMKTPGSNAHTAYEIPSNPMPSPIEYIDAAIPMRRGERADPIRPRLYEVPTAVPRIRAGKVSLIYVELMAYGAP